MRVRVWCVSLLVGGVIATVSCGPDRGRRTPQLGEAAITLEPLKEVQAFQKVDFSTVSDVEWVGDSALALIDVQGGEVLVETLTGSRRVLGHQGQGPGELLYPVVIAVTPSGSELLVADSKAQRISLFDLQTGDFVTAQPIHGMPLSIYGMRDDEVIMSWLPFMGNAGPVVGTINLADGRVTEWYQSLDTDSQLAKAAETGSRFLATEGGARGPLYIASGIDYRILVVDSSGSVLRSFGRPDLPAQFPTEEDVARQRADMMAVMTPRGVTPEEANLPEILEQYKKRQLPYFMTRGLVLDGKGNLWVVRRPGSADSTDIDVFDADGRFSQSLRIRDRVEAMSFRDSLLAVLVQRARGPWADLESVDVYRVGRMEE